MSMPYNNLHIKFFAINDASINAFAFFGGHIAVHSGLILVSDNESELAGVMAHELAHISQQHLLRQIVDSKRLMPVTLAQSLLAIALGVPELIIPAMAGHTQQMLNYSRMHEQEADRLGLQILAKANFDPHGLPNILQRMESTLRYHNKPPEYLLTHPLSESRIADTQSRANMLDYKRQPSSNMFHLIKARLEVQNASNLHHFIQEAEHAKKILDKYKYLHNPEPMFYEYVRQVEGMLGNQTAVLEANAEWYQLHGDFQSAIKQLNIALEQESINNRTSKRIKNRISELEELIARVKKV